MNAITSGKLIARRANSGKKWQIEEADLDDWMRNRTKSEVVKNESYSATESSERESFTQEISNLRSELTVARQQLSEANVRLEERAATIDRLSALIEKLTDRPAAPERRSWWPWSK